MEKSKSKSSKITGIKEQKRKGRLNIYVDGKFRFALPAEALARAGLFVDQEISEKEIERLVKENEFDKLYQKALKFLSYRPRSEKEVRDYLYRKIPALPAGRRANQPKIRANQDVSRTVEPIVAKLKSLELIDDTEFAKWWLEQRQAFRPKGIYALKQELRQKRVSQSIIAQLFNGSIAEEIELEGARKAAQKKLKKLKHPTSKETREKLGAFLSRRGFSYETIKLVLDEILEKE